MIWSFLFLCLIVGVSSLSYRLPTTIKPIQYNLTLHPFFNNFTFDGIASIDINISITHVNQNGTNPFSIQINRGTDMNVNFSSIEIPINATETQKLQHSSMSYNNDSQVLTLNYSISESEMYDKISEWGTNNGMNLITTLLIKYNGLLRFDLKGWYISQYSYESNNLNTTVYNAVTQFESTDARRAFPGWDEPSFKAIFQTTIIAPVNSTVLTNTDQIRFVFFTLLGMLSPQDKIHIYQIYMWCKSTITN